MPINLQKKFKTQTQGREMKNTTKQRKLINFHQYIYIFHIYTNSNLIYILVREKFTIHSDHFTITYANNTKKSGPKLGPTRISQRKTQPPTKSTTSVHNLLNNTTY